MTSNPTAEVKALAALPQPYLLFLGDVAEAGFAKTAIGLHDWAPEVCVAQEQQVRLGEGGEGLYGSGGRRAHEGSSGRGREERRGVHGEGSLLVDLVRSV